MSEKDTNGQRAFWMFSEKKMYRAGNSSDRLSQEEQNAAKAISSWENEEWVMKEKECTGDYMKEAPNGAEALKNILTLPSKGRRDIGKKLLGTCGSREREAVTAALFLLKSK